MNETLLYQAILSLKPGSMFMIWRPTWGSSRPHWQNDWGAWYHSRRKQECRNKTCKWSPGDHTTKIRRAGYEKKKSITMHWFKIEKKGVIVKRAQRSNCSPLWSGQYCKRNQRYGGTVNYGNASGHFNKDNACNDLIGTIRTTSNSFHVFLS